jgi:hypothetical protein
MDGQVSSLREFVRPSAFTQVSDEFAYTMDVNAS